ncbi:hypothetical protein ACFXPY_12945 [Streptomyces sp. NPDC059153]
MRGHDQQLREPRLLHVLGTDLDGDLICMVRLRATDRTCRLAYILREDA